MAADLGITAESLRTWVRKDETQAAPEGRDGSVSAAEDQDDKLGDGEGTPR